MKLENEAVLPRALTRKEIRQLREDFEIDLFSMAVNIGEDEDLKINGIVMDAVLEIAFPNQQNELDELSFPDLIVLFTDIIKKTFGGEEEKNSSRSGVGQTANLVNQDQSIAKDVGSCNDRPENQKTVPLAQLDLQH